MTFAQRRIHLTTHFSERIPVVKWRTSVPIQTDTQIPTDLSTYPHSCLQERLLWPYA